MTTTTVHAINVHLKLHIFMTAYIFTLLLKSKKKGTNEDNQKPVPFFSWNLCLKIESLDDLFMVMEFLGDEEGMQCELCV